MQPVQQAVGRGLVDHEGQVEVVRRLRDQVHPLAPEHLPHRGQLVQQRAHAAPDQGHRRARHDHLDPAHLRQVLRQTRKHVGAHQVLRGIQRHGDVGLGRADQVHRQAMALEGLEHVGQEADLLPHADALHRHQHDAVAAADRLDPGHRGHAALDPGARQLRAAGVEDAHRHAAVAAGLDRARVQDLGAGGGDFLRLGVVQPGQQARIRHVARVGAEHAGHVGPDLDAAGAEQRTEVRGRSIRTAAAEDRGAAIGMAGDEALGQQQLRRLRGETHAQGGIRIEAAVDRQPLRPVAGIGQRDRIQPVARVAPAEIQALPAQVGGTDRGRQQLALRQHLGLPVQRPRCRARIVAEGVQCAQAFADGGVGIDAEFVAAERAMAGDQRGDAALDVIAVADRLQFVGDPGQRRHHHQHARTPGRAGSILPRAM